VRRSSPKACCQIREVKLPNSPELIAEISAFRYRYSSSGKIVLEPKSETSRRAGRSPDLADAAAPSLLVPQASRRPRILFAGGEWDDSGKSDVPTRGWVS